MSTPDSIDEPTFSSLLRPFVEGRDVWDLGCGDLSHAERLLRAGALRVTGVDATDRVKDGVLDDPRVTFRKEYLDFLHQPDYRDMEVAYCSWPHQFGSGLRGITEWVPCVVFVGKNSDGTSCGERSMWDVLVKRRVLLYEPSRRESLIVYGREDADRPLLPDELAALDHEHIWGFDDLMALRGYDVRPRRD